MLLQTDTKYRNSEFIALYSLEYNIIFGMMFYSRQSAALIPEFWCFTKYCRTIYPSKKGGNKLELSRVIAQVAIRRLPTAAGRFRSQITTRGICGGQNGTGAGFLLVLRPPPRARSTVVGWGTVLQAGRSRVRVPMRLLFFFNLPNPSSRTMTLGLTQHLTEISTRNLPGE
jgi:hypothetical protein